MSNPLGRATHFVHVPPTLRISRPSGRLTINQGILKPHSRDASYLDMPARLNIVLTVLLSSNVTPQTLQPAIQFLLVKKEIKSSQAALQIH